MYVATDNPDAMSLLQQVCVRDTIALQKPIGGLIFIGHFLKKSPGIDGSSAERDLRLKASYGSSPPCIRGCELLIIIAGGVVGSVLCVATHCGYP